MAGPRSRDSILAGLEAFRQVRADANLTNLLAFLYICENEGLNVSELGRMMGATMATASRTASVLERAAEGGPSLVRSCAGDRHPHSRVLHLSRQGLALRERLDGLIARATPIQISDAVDVAKM